MSGGDKPYAVQKFGSGFAIVYRDPDTQKRVRLRLAAASRLEAEAEAAQRWQGGERATGTVAGVVAAHITDLESNEQPSASRAKDAWKAMRPFWEHVPPGMVDDAMAKAYAAQRRAGPNTIRYELGMLSVALRKAKFPGNLWRPPAPDRQERHLTREQFKRLLAGCVAPHARLYMKLGIYTAARPSAILDLTWDRVDLERGTLNLNPPGRVQTAKRRPVVALNDEAIDELRAAYSARTSVYVIERGGKKVANIKKAFQAASKRSSVHATPYTLRHTAAVWMAEADVPMAQIAQFLGHDDSATTEKHYARFSPSFLRGAANALKLA